jgi:D-sedoheptulose 7-phosphate isomerase
MSNTPDLVRQSIGRSRDVVASLADHAEAIAAAADAVVEALARGGKVLSAGHGGSAADAMHIAEELTGRFEGDRPPLPAMSLVADGPLFTCIANDYGFTQLFPRQVEAHGKVGDVLLIFSTSGRGDGLIEAARLARDRGLVTLAFLGKGGGDVAPLVDHPIVVASDETARIQEAHGVLLHLVLEAVERRFGLTAPAEESAGP